MKKLNNVIMLMALAMSVVTCSKRPETGPPNPAGTFKLNGAEYRVVDRSNLKTSDSSVSGTGGLVFREAIKEKSSNFELAFSLQANGTLTLSTYANSDLAQGVNLAFTRLPDNKLGVVASVGTEVFVRSSVFQGIDASKPITLNVDVHDHGDLIIELGGQEDSVEFKTRVSGNIWGLSMKDASVTHAVVAKAKHAH